MIENRISDRAKILLIDEDTSISYLIRRAMEKENYKIYIAGSGKQGMEMSTGVCPDLILMDKKFSDMDIYDKDSKDLKKLDTQFRKGIDGVFTFHKKVFMKLKQKKQN